MCLWKHEVSSFKEMLCPFTAFIEIYFPQPCQWADKRLNKCDLFYIPPTEKQSVLTKLYLEFLHNIQNTFAKKKKQQLRTSPKFSVCAPKWTWTISLYPNHWCWESDVGFVVSVSVELVWNALVISFISHLSSTGVSWLCSAALTGCRRTATLRLPQRWRRSLWTAESTATWWPRSPPMRLTSHSPSSFIPSLQSAPKPGNPEQYSWTISSNMLS